MKHLIDILQEECATPGNTVGMGNIEPLSTDPVPINTNILKKKKNRRRRK